MRSKTILHNTYDPVKYFLALKGLRPAITNNSIILLPVQEHIYRYSFSANCLKKKQNIIQ